MREEIGISLPILRRYTYSLKSEEAVHHLFSVASGLDSMVKGEQQIQGQVNDALESAIRAGTAGPFLLELFRNACRVSKSVRKLIELDRASVSTAAISLLRHVSAGHDIRRILLVGAGKMAGLVAQQPTRDAKADIWIANRTFSRAEELALKFGARPLPLDEIPDTLQTVDAVICSAHSPNYIIRTEDLEVAVARRENKPIFLIDIAVPRNIDPKGAMIPGVHLYNIDDLAHFLEAYSEPSEIKITKAKHHIDIEVEKFCARIRNRKVLETIRELRIMSERIRKEELSGALRLMADLSDHDRKVIETLTRRIINKLLHEPTIRLRRQADQMNGSNHAATICELFGIPVGSKQ